MFERSILYRELISKFPFKFHAPLAARQSLRRRRRRSVHVKKVNWDESSGRGGKKGAPIDQHAMHSTRMKNGLKVREASQQFLFFSFSSTGAKIFKFLSFTCRIDVKDVQRVACRWMTTTTETIAIIITTQIDSNFQNDSFYFYEFSRENLKSLKDVEKKVYQILLGCFNSRKDH